MQSEPLLACNQILSSPDVSVPPERINRPVAVPSVFQDERGEIHNFLVGGKRINLLYSKGGIMRSGDIHKDTQNDFIFSGKVRVWILDSETKATVKTEYGPNEYIAIPPFVPHIFEFLEDSVMAEWWDGPFHSWFYDPYRKIVEQSFTASKPGVFAHYIIKKKFDNNLSFAIGGFMFGVAVGFMLSRVVR